MDLEYGILRIIWWLILNVLFIGIAIMEGYDMGTAGLLNFLGKNNHEKRTIINSIGPYWEGNQVWLILGIGAIFAAFPLLYGAVGSGIYFGFLLILYALIVRPVSFKFRSKIKSSRWQGIWDFMLGLSGFVPPILFGLILGSLFRGFPVTMSNDLNVTFHGSGLFYIISPMGILGAILIYLLFMLQGASYLIAKISGPVMNRAQRIIPWAAFLALVVYVIFFVSLFYINGYRITSPIDIGGPSNPLMKTVSYVMGAWMDNYLNYPVLFIMPLLVVLGIIVELFMGLGSPSHRKGKVMMVINSVVLAMVILSWATALFPFMFPSYLQLSASLTVWDASSSLWSLWVMLISVIIFLPIILCYTGWVIYKLRGPLNSAESTDDSRYQY